MALKATEVFVPGAYPQHTYVERSAQGLEEALRNALDTPGQIVSLSGPSKSGKTVLVERVVGRDLLIPVSGASLRHPDDVWNRVLDWMDLPGRISETRRLGATLGADVGVKGGVGVPFVAKAEGSSSVYGEIAGETTTEAVHGRRGLSQVVHEIGSSDFVILLDDFHYMDRLFRLKLQRR